MLSTLTWHDWLAAVIVIHLAALIGHGIVALIHWIEKRHSPKLPEPIRSEPLPAVTPRLVDIQYSLGAGLAQSQAAANAQSALWNAMQNRGISPVSSYGARLLAGTGSSLLGILGAPVFTSGPPAVIYVPPAPRVVSVETPSPKLLSAVPPSEREPS